MDGRGDAKHSYDACLSHALLSESTYINMMIYNRKRYAFLIHGVLIAPFTSRPLAVTLNFFLDMQKNLRGKVLGELCQIPPYHTSMEYLLPPVGRE